MRGGRPGLKFIGISDAAYSCIPHREIHARIVVANLGPVDFPNLCMCVYFSPDIIVVHHRLMHALWQIPAGVHYNFGFCLFMHFLAEIIIVHHR